MKNEYLEALHQADLEIGTDTSVGVHASIFQIRHFLRYFKALVAMELKYNIDFAKEQSPNVWWYDGQRIVFRSPSTSKMLNAMRLNPDITIEALSKEVGIVTAAIKNSCVICKTKVISKGKIKIGVGTYWQRHQFDGYGLMPV